PDPLDNVVAELPAVIGQDAEALLEPAEAGLLDAREDGDDAIARQDGQACAHSLGGCLVEVHIQLDGAHLELIASPIQVLLHLAMINLELLELAGRGEALSLELGPLLLQLLDLAARVADLLDGLGLSLGALSRALERRAAHPLDLTDEALLANDLLGHVASRGGDDSSDLEELTSQVGLALRVRLLLRLELGDRLRRLADLLCVVGATVGSDLQLALDILVGLALRVDGRLRLIDARDPLPHRRLIHVDLELQPLGAQEGLGGSLQNLRHAVDVLVDLLAVDQEVHVDVEPLAARHATEVLLDAARVRVDREFVAGAAKLSLELPDGALGVQVEQAALPLLAELLVELSLELDLLLVGQRLHSPTDVANLRGELAVR